MYTSWVRVVVSILVSAQWFVFQQNMHILSVIPNAVRELFKQKLETLSLPSVSSLTAFGMTLDRWVICSFFMVKIRVYGN